MHAAKRGGSQAFIRLNKGVAAYESASGAFRERSSTRTAHGIATAGKRERKGGGCRHREPQCFWGFLNTNRGR